LRERANQNPLVIRFLRKDSNDASIPLDELEFPASFSIEPGSPGNETALPPILSFTDQEIAALRSAAATLSPEQRDQFLRDVASELRRCRKLGPSDRTGHAVAQIAKAVAKAVATAVQRRLANGTSMQRIRQPTAREGSIGSPADANH
jgi:hypothetical protein